MTNFAQQLSAAVADDPDHPAVKLDDAVLSYGVLDAAVARCAGLLRARGLGAGDRVGLQMPNVPYFPIVYYGALRLGAVVVPMNPLLKDREVAYYLSDSGAKLMVAWHDFADAARGGSEQAGAECIVAEPGGFDEMLAGAEPVGDVADRADDDPAVIIYTSGTTGAPKGAMLTHANLAAGAAGGRGPAGAPRGGRRGRPRPRGRRPRLGDRGDAPAVPRVRDELDHERHGARAGPDDAR